jgi:hypothetical protein
MPAPTVEDLMSVARDSNPDAEWIVMHHPETKGVTVVTKESFDQDGGHKSKGWREGEPKGDDYSTGDFVASQRSDQPTEANPSKTRSKEA